MKINKTVEAVKIQQQQKTETPKKLPEVPATPLSPTTFGPSLPPHLMPQPNPKPETAAINVNPSLSVTKEPLVNSALSGPSSGPAANEATRSTNLSSLFQSTNPILSKEPKKCAVKSGPKMPTEQLKAKLEGVDGLVASLKNKAKEKENTTFPSTTFPSTPFPTTVPSDFTLKELPKPVIKKSGNESDDSLMSDIEEESKEDSSPVRKRKCFLFWI